MRLESAIVILLCICAPFFPTLTHGRRSPAASRSARLRLDEPLTYLWPLPKQFRHGNATLTVDPDIFFHLQGAGGNSSILGEALERYKRLIFGYNGRLKKRPLYDLRKLTLVVASGDEMLHLGVDESYNLLVAQGDDRSIVAAATIEANTIYGAIRGLETFSQLCTFNFKTKSVVVHKTPWFIQDQPRFKFRGLLIDTSRHYLPVNVIKLVIESMSYAKLNVLHWHIIDEESFPLEVPSYPDLWRGSYTKWERYSVEDAYEIVDYAKKRGVNIMPEIDVPGHAESWGKGYPDLWPSPTCTEPLDVSKNFTFEVISGILRGSRSTT